jgi:phospholipid/cholesterol/gamma-HCH transport system substrate-binding protein
MLSESKPKITKILDYIEESGPSFSNSIKNIELISSAIKENKGALGKIINNPELYDELLASAETVKNSFQQFENLLKENRDNIDNIIIDVKESVKPVRESFENMSVITDKIKKGEGTIGKLVADTELYTQTKNTINKISENLEDQREQSIMSSFTNSILSIFKF